jgi:hypothetical protein
MSVPPAFAATRGALHAVAEHVLASALHRATGRIGLRPTPGGFGTPWFTDDGSDRQVRVDGTDIVVADGADTRRTPLSTVGEAAAFVGIEPGAPAEVYRPATPLERDAPLDVDAAAAAIVHAWFHLNGAAVEALRRARRAGAVDRPALARALRPRRHAGGGQLRRLARG